MSESKRIRVPFEGDTVLQLRAGDRLLLTGRILTGRDAAHKRLIELIEAGQELPIEVNGQIIYYVGPSPALPGMVVGSAGPTTAYRMDRYVRPLLERGLKGTIGKGFRTAPVKEALQEFGAVHMHAIGGLGALLSKQIKRERVLCYEDLATEAIREYEIENFPVIVVNDAHGNDFYNENVAKYRQLPDIVPQWSG